MKKITLIAPPRCNQDKLRIPDAFHISELGFSEYIEYLNSYGVNIELIDLNYIINGVYNIENSDHNTNFIDLTLFSNHTNYTEIINYLADCSFNKTIAKYIDSKVEKVLKRIGSLDADVFCILIGWPSRVLIGLALAKYLKRITNKIIILSNPKRNIFFDEPFNIRRLIKFDFIDFIIEKPGKNILDIFNLLKSNKLKSNYLINVPDIILKNKQEVIQTDSNNNEIDLNELPLPNWTHLKNKKIKLLIYELALGCPFKCFYCFFVNQTLFHKKPEKIVKELSILRRKYNCKYFYFNTTAINISLKFLDKFLFLMEKENLDIRWLSYAYPKGLDYKTLLRMYKVGCRMLDIGIDQGSQTNLNLIERDPKITEVMEFLKNCKKIGIFNYVAFIIGFPELNNDAEYVCQFLEKNKDYIDFFSLNQFDIHKANLKNVRRKWKDIKILNNKLDDRNYPFIESRYGSFENRITVCDKKEKMIIEKAKKLGINFIRCAYNRNNFDLEEFYLRVLKR